MTEPTEGVDRAIVEYFELVDRGEVVDTEQFIARHEELADPLREFFELIDFALLDYLIIGGVTVVWAVMLRYVWRRRMFERFLQLDQDFHRLTR